MAESRVRANYVKYAIVRVKTLPEPEREAEAEKLLSAGFAAGSDGPTVTIDTLPRADAAEKPVDMRPYVCGKTRMPPELASFGTMAPLPRPKP